METFMICTPLPVLEASDTELKLKFFNVSAKMRKRIKKITENVLCKPKFAEIAVKVAGKVKISSSKVLLKGAQKGVTNYLVRSQKELSKLKEPFECSLNLCSELEESVFAKIDKLVVNPCNWRYYSKCRFKFVRFLSLDSLRSGQTTEILGLIDKIKRAKLKFCGLEPETARNLRKLEEIELLESRITGQITLNSLQTLVEVRSTGIHLINSPNVLQISLKRETIDLKEQKWLESCGKLKKLNLKTEKINFDFENLAKTVRNFYFTGIMDASIAIKNFPNLRILKLPGSSVKISSLNKTKIKKIEAGIENDSNEQIDFNLREATIDSELFNTHPEIIKNCSKIEVLCSDFNFSNLPSDFEEIILTKYQIEGEKGLTANLIKLKEKTVNLTRMYNISKINELIPVFPSIKALKVKSGFVKTLKRKYPNVNII